MQVLISDRIVRRTAQVVLFGLFLGICAVWAAAAFFIVVRAWGDSPHWFARPLLKALGSPFKGQADFSTLLPILSAVIPAFATHVCFAVNTRTDPWTVSSKLNRTGYAIFFACLVGVAIGFTTLVIVRAYPDAVNELSADAFDAIVGLLAATIAFFGMYLGQLVGLQQLQQPST